MLQAAQKSEEFAPGQDHLACKQRDHDGSYTNSADNDQRGFYVQYGAQQNTDGGETVAVKQIQLQRIPADSFQHPS